MKKVNFKKEVIKISGYNGYIFNLKWLENKLKSHNIEVHTHFVNLPLNITYSGSKEQDNITTFEGCITIENITFDFEIKSNVFNPALIHGSEYKSDSFCLVLNDNILRGLFWKAGNSNLSKGKERLLQLFYFRTPEKLHYIFTDNRDDVIKKLIKQGFKIKKDYLGVGKYIYTTNEEVFNYFDNGDVLTFINYTRVEPESILNISDNFIKKDIEIFKVGF